MTTKHIIQKNKHKKTSVVVWLAERLHLLKKIVSHDKYQDEMFNDMHIQERRKTSFYFGLAAPSRSFHWLVSPLLRVFSFWPWTSPPRRVWIFDPPRGSQVWLDSARAAPGPGYIRRTYGFWWG